MSLFASPSFPFRAFAFHLALASLGLSLAGCASPGVEATEANDDGSGTDDDSAARDAGKSTKDAGSSSTKDAGRTKPSTPSTTEESGSADAGAQSVLDASTEEAGDVGTGGAGLDWDALLGADGGLSTPPGPASPDNPKECPETAPENPIGSCIGVPVYATCKYGDYTCLCDWIHWLCI